MSSNMKTEFKWFTITQYQQEEEYLRRMHQNGWQLMGIGFPGFYHFKECEPQDVVYKLDYNREGVAHKAEYTRMFADCGWSYLFDFVGYSYFCKPASEAEAENDIFCDDESRLEMLRRVMKGRLLPLLIIFLMCVLPNAVTNSLRAAEGDPWARGFMMFYIVMIVLYLVIFGVFGYDYWKLSRKLR